MSEQAKTSIFKKDKNNNLSNKQCVDFIKNYKDFKNGIVSKITNPKTDKPLNNEDRIKYIYNYCKQKLGIEVYRLNLHLLIPALMRLS
jgi:aminopeptidase C